MRWRGAEKPPGGSRISRTMAAAARRFMVLLDSIAGSLLSLKSPGERRWIRSPCFVVVSAGYARRRARSDAPYPFHDGAYNSMTRSKNSKWLLLIEQI